VSSRTRRGPDRPTARGRRRRVSLGRARSAAARGGLDPIPQSGEKLAVTAVTAILATLLLGAGTGLGPGAWAGLLLLAGAALGIFARFLSDFRRRLVRSTSLVVGLAGGLLAALALVRVFDTLLGLEHLAFLPLSFFALVLALTFSRGLAIEATALLAAFAVLYLLLRGRAGTAELSGIAVAVSGAVAAGLASERVRRRASLVRIGLVIGGVQAAVAAGFLALGLEPGDGAGLVGVVPLFQLALLGLTVGLLVSGLLPAIEILFGVTTDISLLELGNTHEQPLLKKLLLEAPGTFHHSYIVGLLSEAAAEAMGGNALLARVGALYHDVGKLEKPGYFAENSPDARGRHKTITPEMSGLIISAHPRDGVELGREYGLPQGVLDFMLEHHGTNLIEYFYHRARELRGEENVREATFRYPGPRPQRLEAAIVMLADAVEAISRQMPDPTQARLTEMVHEVSQKRLMERQFDECGLTLRDLDRIERAFVRVLLGIYHTRPTYPKGRPHPLDLSQSGELRRAAAAGEERRSVGSGS